jgi:hypothetical protein
MTRFLPQDFNVHSGQLKSGAHLLAASRHPLLKIADDYTTPPAQAPQMSSDVTAPLPTGKPGLPPPPTTTNIPREHFDKIMASKGVTYDQHLDNLESHFNAATPEQQKRGRVWYRAGGDTLRDIGNKFGISTNRAIAMAAALSSRTDWNNNLHFAAHMAGNYRPGENEDEWQRANVHPSAMARYMESKYDITPGAKGPLPDGSPDRTHPDHFSAKELGQLKANGYMPRTKADFNQLADAHSGDHLQYVPASKPTKNNPEGRPEQWVNQPLRGFEGLQDPQGRAAWLNNAQMPNRGGTQSDRQRYEDAIDGHIRQVRDSTSPYGFDPRSPYTGAGVPTLGGNVEKAKLLRNVGEDEFDTHLNGPKYKAFFANLGNNLKFRKTDNPMDQGYYDHGDKHWTEHDPDYQRSTIDTQHMRAASQPHGSSIPAPGYKEGSQVTPEQYEVYQQGMADLTHRINSKLPRDKQLMPHQVQAIIWGKFKDDQKKKRKDPGQTYFSPTMDDIQGFGDRYSRLLRFLASEGYHIDPKLLEYPASDPYETDSDDWWDAVLGSWEQNHQHELAHPSPTVDQADSPLQRHEDQRMGPHPGEIEASAWYTAGSGKGPWNNRPSPQHRPVNKPTINRFPADLAQGEEPEEDAQGEFDLTASRWYLPEPKLSWYVTADDGLDQGDDDPRKKKPDAEPVGLNTGGETAGGELPTYRIPSGGGGGGGSMPSAGGGGASMPSSPSATGPAGHPDGGPPSQNMTQALQRAGIDPSMYPLISGFSATEGNNPSGVPTFGFKDTQAGTTLDGHAQALSKQIQDRQSVAGPFPHAGTPEQQASWMATLVGQDGVKSDWNGEAQPARSDYVNRIVKSMPGSAPAMPGSVPATGM